MFLCKTDIWSTVIQESFQDFISVISRCQYHSIPTIMQNQLLSSEIKIDNWIITKWLILTKVDFNLLPKPRFTLLCLSSVLHWIFQHRSCLESCVLKNVVLWLCLKELMKARSPPALSTAQQFHRSKSILLILEFWKCRIFVYVPLFCFSGNLQIMIVEQLVFLALDLFK